MTGYGFVSLLIPLSLIGALKAQEAVTISVDASRTEGPLRPAWNYFGYDEPNYTYAPNGRKLLTALAGLSRDPVHVRTHNLLTSGNGTAALKWGSTNAYTEDAAGKAIYDWTIDDRILDTYLAAGIRPFVEIGFMPEALSRRPEPYRHTFPKGDVFTGWSYPPNDLGKWSSLVFEWVKHCADRYGRKQAASWDWEVWNEPDIGYWHGTPEEYDSFYDATAAAVKRALPEARVGGPASTGPGGARAAAFLRQFLEHCSARKTPLDFVTFHAKGKPQTIGEHVVMGLSQELRDAAEGFAILRSFEQFRDLPVVLSEADPEGCAACSARTNPANAYRNGALYAAYEAVAYHALEELARRDGIHLAGVLTWAFEFESQPYFEGFRTLATNGIDKPVLNFFRMAGLLRGQQLHVASSGRVPLDELLQTGVRRQDDVDAIAARSERNLSVLVWNYRDEDVPAAAADVRLKMASLPPGVNHMLVTHYRIDGTHSNAFTLWKQLGSPQEPSPEQYRALEQSGQLELLESPRWINVNSALAELRFSLPVAGLSLLDLSW